jgi:hypothetical protein
LTWIKSRSRGGSGTAIAVNEAGQPNRKETMMKKLLIAATLSAAALATPSLFADPGHQHGQRQAGATENCQMGAEHGQRAERHAQMQARMAARHAQTDERHGGGRAEHRGQHQNRGEGCPMQQAPST